MLTVSAHLRTTDRTSAPTDRALLALVGGLAEAGCKIDYRPRGAAPGRDADLVVQWGLARSNALREALDRELPYLIAEAPHYRLGEFGKQISYGYGGLGAGAFHARPPAKRRKRPELRAWHDGPTAIALQKPNDHSLRGSDHNAWAAKYLDRHPDMEVRPHPIMVGNSRVMEPVDEFLARIGHLITYSSTIGGEALVAGCRVTADHYGSMARPYLDGEFETREEWLHWLTWTSFHIQELWTREVAKHILSGFEEARERARLGQQELPREKTRCPAGYDGRINDYLRRISARAANPA